MIARRLLVMAVLTVTFGGGWGAVAASHGTNAALRADETVYNGLFAVAVADQIRTNCDVIGPRMFRAIGFLHSLESHARSQGFSQEEIDAFIDSEEEQERMRGHVMAYFEEHGVDEDAPETYCALGRAEIERGSQAGALLRAR
ncbi:hypothetical protein C2I36_02525 [Rhodobacteraceae bacterium WD3A24]|nr:hypothetical protein C2I36_02525 [Rhodobacteraceae bacterium WD3A24]